MLRARSRFSAEEQQCFERGVYFAIKDTNASSQMLVFNWKIRMLRTRCLFYYENYECFERNAYFSMKRQECCERNACFEMKDRQCPERNPCFFHAYNKHAWGTLFSRKVSRLITLLFFLDLSLFSAISLPVTSRGPQRLGKTFDRRVALLMLK